MGLHHCQGVVVWMKPAVGGGSVSLIDVSGLIESDKRLVEL